VLPEASLGRLEQTFYQAAKHFQVLNNCTWYSAFPNSCNIRLQYTYACVCVYTYACVCVCVCVIQSASDALIWNLADIPITDKYLPILIADLICNFVQIFYISLHIFYLSVHNLTVLQAIFPSEYWLLIYIVQHC